jgi:hypothetical protein
MPIDLDGSRDAAAAPLAQLQRIFDAPLHRAAQQLIDLGGVSDGDRQSPHQQGSLRRQGFSAPAAGQRLAGRRSVAAGAVLPHRALRRRGIPAFRVGNPDLGGQRAHPT